MKIVADDKIPFLRGALESVATVEYLGGSNIGRDDIADADAIITRTRTRCDADLLDGSSVKAVFTATIGYDHIDTAYCQSKNIYWQNAPACNSSSVCQYISSAFAVLRLRCGITFRGKTIAIIGVGNVGSLVVDLSLRLGMKVLKVDPVRAKKEGEAGFTDLHTALGKADIVSFHTPLTKHGSDATLHLLNDETLSWIKPGAVVINSARGAVCDTSALIGGLRSGHISHAVIDVWENEPAINRELMELATLATPHIAGYSTDSKLRGTQITIEALCGHFGLSTSWQPPTLPPPTEASFDAEGCADEEEAACKMFLHVYNIEDDSAALRQKPTDFEHLRGDYNLRREIEAYYLKEGTPYADYLAGFGIRKCNK